MIYLGDVLLTGMMLEERAIMEEFSPNKSAGPSRSTAKIFNDANVKGLGCE